MSPANYFKGGFKMKRNSEMLRDLKTLDQTIGVKLIVKMKPVNVFESSLSPDESVLEIKIRNVEDIEKEIQKQISNIVEGATGQKVNSCGSWILVRIPESFYLQK
jgi:hypothetical protein